MLVTSPFASIRRTVLPVLVVIVAVGALVAVLLIRTMDAKPNPNSGTKASSSVVSADWQTYRDPLGLYILRYPPDWTASSSNSSHAIAGNRSGSFAPTITGVTFSDPSQGSGSARVSVIETAISGSIEQQYYCPSVQPGSAGTFHGIQMNKMLQLQPSMMVVTTNVGVFQFNLTIPGVLSPAGFGGIYLTPLPTPTALPAGWTGTDEADIAGILTSFQLANPEAALCTNGNESWQR